MPGMQSRAEMACGLQKSMSAPECAEQLTLTKYDMQSSCSPRLPRGGDSCCMGAELECARKAAWASPPSPLPSSSSGASLGFLGGVAHTMGALLLW